eukprot:scaffold492436_cov13-Prasinocladus_malaysianus.AAC.1
MLSNTTYKPAQSCQLSIIGRRKLGSAIRAGQLTLQKRGLKHCHVRLGYEGPKPNESEFIVEEFSSFRHLASRYKARGDEPIINIASC